MPEVARVTYLRLAIVGPRMIYIIGCSVGGTGVGVGGTGVGVGGTGVGVGGTGVGEGVGVPPTVWLMIEKSLAMPLPNQPPATLNSAPVWVPAGMGSI